MTWNYRIIKRTVEIPPDYIEDHYAIYEVYYNSEGNIIAWTENPMYPYGLSADELYKDLQSMSEAYNKPILDYKQLEEEICGALESDNPSPTN